MFGVAFSLDKPLRIANHGDRRLRRVAEILEARERILASRDILYCSPSIRSLIEDDIPTLVSLISETKQKQR